MDTLVFDRCARYAVRVARAAIPNFGHCTAVGSSKVALLAGAAPPWAMSIRRVVGFDNG